MLINAAALWVASQFIPGIRLDDILPALLAGTVLGILNAVVRPVLIVLTLPITLLTLGLFIFVLNAFTLWLTSRIVPGFEVDGPGAALLGALVVSAVSWVLTAFLSDRGRVRRIEIRRLRGPRD